MLRSSRFLIASCVSAALLACGSTGGPAAPGPQLSAPQPQDADGLYAQGRAHHAAQRLKMYGHFSSPILMAQT